MNFKEAMASSYHHNTIYETNASFLNSDKLENQPDIIFGEKASCSYFTNPFSAVVDW